MNKNYGEWISASNWIKSTVICNEMMNVLYMLGILSQPPMIMGSYTAIMKLTEDKGNGTSRTSREEDR